MKKSILFLLLVMIIIPFSVSARSYNRHRNRYYIASAIKTSTPEPTLTLVSTPTPAPASTSAIISDFGIKQLYQTSGRVWVSNWNNGIARTIASGERDQYDPYKDFIARGDGDVKIDGKGIATLTGDAPRMYLYDALKQKKWGNVEITFYAKRVSEAYYLSYAGFMAGAKTDHTLDSNLCGTRGYFGRMLYDGRMDFEKEINHHASDGYVQFGSIKPWASLPKNQWIGYKFVARDEGGAVKLEMYRDLTEGLNGGTWVLMTSAVDSGQYGAGHSPCAIGVNPAQALTGSNVAIYVRNDGLGSAQYKWFSVREIK